MPKNQYDKCTRSISDGNLANSHQNVTESGDTDCRTVSRDKQMFFTLPRWMNKDHRKRNRSKIKYVKVDVPFNSENAYNSEKNVDAFCVQKRDSDKSSHFISKLFRRNSLFSSSSSAKHSSVKLPVRVPTSQSISASNTDIRCSNSLALHFFDYQEYFKDKIPAVCGIRNHGNTCFMNAVIQCLSNTESFAEYFVMDHYKLDVLRRNKKHSKKYGTRGEVTEQLGVLLKSLWSCQYSSNVSNKFKTLVAKYGIQYEGSEQHDAQEFLLWLLDKVHEDLNTAPEQKYRKPKGTYGRTDEEIAAKMLANHLRCNNSFVHDLFQGQFRSSLCCLGCGQFSNTFDPYLCVSLPVPHYQTIPVYLYLILLNEKVKMFKIGILLDSQSTVSDLCEKLKTNFGSSSKNFLLTEVIDGEFQRTFCDSDFVTHFSDSQHIYAIEIPPQNIDANIEREKVLLVFLCRVKVCEDIFKMVWRPFALEVLREASYEELKIQIFTALSVLLKEDFDLKMKDPFCLSIVGDDSACEILNSSVDLPLYMPIIDQALMLCDGREQKHVKIYLELNVNFEDVLKTDVPFVEEDSSVEAVMNMKRNFNEVSLYECFDLYFNEEKLGVEDAWMCPCCHHRLPSVKQLSLWTVPDIFIVHLKRFRQSSCQRTKITTFVEFPFAGLDMNRYIATRNNSVQQQSHNGSLHNLTTWSPWKRSRSHQFTKGEDNVYDLYAVCNHHGNMQGGHYTAYCRNPVDCRWYLFDDTKVQEVQASEVISADAYILFYQRSNLTVHSCASSASSGYSSASSTYSVGPDHWAFRMPLSSREVSRTSKSQDNLYDVGNTASLDRRTISVHRPFMRASKPYSTMYHYTEERVCSPVQQNVCERHPLKKTVEDDDAIPPPPPVKHYWTVTSV